MATPASNQEFARLPLERDLRIVPRFSRWRAPFDWLLPNTLAALVVTAPFVPVLAAFMTVVTAAGGVIGNEVFGPPHLAMFLYVLVAWLLLAIPCIGLALASADHVNPGSYGELASRLSELQAWCERRPAEHGADDDGSGSPERRGPRFRSFCSQVASIERDLTHRDLRWVLGSGYVTLWRRLHAAQALLIHFEARPAVIARADNARSRLADSNINGGPGMAAALDEAIRSLMQSAATEPSTPNPAPPIGEVGFELSLLERQARAAIGQVEQTINNYRTNRYAGLVVARKQMSGAAGLTAAMLYALLWLVVAAHGEAGVIQAAACCYLLGGLVGLFNLLYAQAEIDSAVDDYGLTTARLLAIPQLSGIAAVLGVIITSIVAATQTEAATLQASFDLMAHPSNILTAAIFALSPSLVLKQLRQRMESYKAELKSSRRTQPIASGRHRSPATQLPSRAGQ